MGKVEMKYKCLDCEFESDDEDGVCLKCGGKLQEIKKTLKLETHELKDVEIFEAGNWKGKDYTEKDIDEAIVNFQAGVLEPYINLNHDAKLSEKVTKDLKVASLGFVSAMKRNGKKLLADFRQVPKVIAELIQAGALKKRSVEWWSKYKHANGKFMDNVLEAVTFHGADGVPAVNTLADIVNLYKAEHTITEHEGEHETLMLEDLKVGEIKIDQAEYDALKAKAERVSKLEAEISVVAEKMKASDAVVSRADSAEKELAKLKAERETEKAAALKAEAEGYVIPFAGKKFLPKMTDRFVAEYIRCKSTGDEAGLALLKEDIESRGDAVNLGPVTGAVPAGTVEFKSERDDAKAGADPTARAEQAIQAMMKRDNIDWMAAAKKLGIISGEDEGGSK